MSLKQKLLKNYNNLKQTLKKICQKNKDRFKFAWNLFLYSLIYGLILNFMLWSIFDIHFTIFSFIGYGILVYLIKVELVQLINKLFPKLTK